MDYITLEPVTRPNPSQQRPPLMWELLRDYPNAVCKYCGVKHKEVRNGKKFTLTRDHILPLARGGADTLENIQFLCQKCNHDKGHNLQ